jgi:hypothetical protein
MSRFVLSLLGFGLVRLFAVATVAGPEFAVTQTAAAAASAAHSTAPTSATARRQALITQWRQRMITKGMPGVGCFVGKYPAEQWQKQSECAKLPPDKKPSHAPRPRPQDLQTGLHVTGNGNDLVAVAVGAPIKAVEGYFNPTVNFQSVMSGPQPGANSTDYYGVQINSDNFTTDSCKNAVDPSKCRGWLQFLFFATPTNVFGSLELWLMGFGPTCPGEGNVPALPGWDQLSNPKWQHSGNDCVYDAQTTPPITPTINIKSLGILRFRAQAESGGFDSMIITLPNGQIYGASLPDSLLQTSVNWWQAEFNVLGFINGERATFNSGAATVVHLEVENGTNNAPTIGTSGTTGETNNFDLVTPGCTSANPPSIAFAEVTLSGQVSTACPPQILPIPPPPPPPVNCSAQAALIRGLRKQEAQAEARLQDQELCGGPARFMCIKNVQTIGAQLSSAVTYARQHHCPVLPE